MNTVDEFVQVNDIRPGADPKKEKIKNQLVNKHGADYKTKVGANLTIFKVTIKQKLLETLRSAFTYFLPFSRPS